MLQKITIDSIVDMLRITCDTEEKRVPGSQCGCILLFAETSPDIEGQVRVRSYTLLPADIAMHVLEVALIDMRLKAGIAQGPDNGAEESPPPGETLQ